MKEFKVYNCRCKVVPIVTDENGKKIQLGFKLQDILPQCKEGDVLECVKTRNKYLTKNKKYPVVYDDYYAEMAICDDYKNYQSESVFSLFIKKDIQQCAQQVNEDKPVDGHKAFDLIKGLL